MPTRAFLLTPAGRGAVATIAVCGDHAWPTVADCCHIVTRLPAASAPALGQVVFARWPIQRRAPTNAPARGDAPAVAASPADEVVLCRLAEDRVEVHCHGGSAACQAVLQSLADRGCPLGDWRSAAEFFSAEPLAAQAAVAACQAQTDRTAAILLDQHDGALSKSIATLCDQLRGENPAAALPVLQQLLNYENVGRHLLAPFKVVLAGAPNVGKSSLVNRIAGFERSITFDQPGTTRDVVSVATVIDGWPVELADTAGLRGAGDAIEMAGMAAAEQAVAAADLPVLVWDATAPWNADAGSLAARWPHALSVFNKCDLAQPSPAATTVLGEVLRVSARTGEGLEALLSAIAQRLVPSAPPAGVAVPFLPRHFDLLRECLAHLNRGDAPAAIAAARALGH